MTPDGYVPPPVIRQRAQAGEWLARAACRGMDPELFFPDRGESTEQAKAVCAACPVRAECLDHALTNVERFGIWGGLSERERRAIRRARTRAARADRSAAA
jgi:WhiB family redox-sensing transcriptional regulator